MTVATYSCASKRRLPTTNPRQYGNWKSGISETVAGASGRPLDRAASGSAWRGTAASSARSADVTSGVRMQYTNDSVDWPAAHGGAAAPSSVWQIVAGTDQHLASARGPARGPARGAPPHARRIATTPGPSVGRTRALGPLRRPSGTRRFPRP